MKFSVKRFHPDREPKSIVMDYETSLKAPTLLEALTQVKQTKDATLTFASGCRSSVCGSCAIRVNGKEQLACTYKLQENDTIEPLNYMEVIKDLVVNHDNTQVLHKRANNVTHGHKQATMTQEEEHAIAVQSDCILCGSCYSACPIEAVNSDFLGPFALTRSWRYVNDSREADNMPIMNAIQTNGIWDCTLCNECSLVCPQGISSKSDIAMLQGKAGVLGFMNPKFAAGFGNDFGTPDFGVPQF